MSLEQPIAITGGTGFVGQAVLVDEVEQAPVFGVFENYVGGFVLLVEAVVIHFYDVQVLQLHVDFYF